MNAKAKEIAREFSLGNPVIIATGDEWRNTKLSLSRNNGFSSGINSTVRDDLMPSRDSKSNLSFAGSLSARMFSKPSEVP
jgi:hypothetical protein